MASLLTHTYFGIKLQEKYGFDDSLLLGEIMPDMLKHKYSRPFSHFITDNTDAPDIDFYLSQRQIDSVEELGYYMHLVQDNLWFNEIKKYLKTHSNWTPNEITKSLYIGMNMHDYYIMSQLGYSQEDLEALKERIKAKETNDEIIGIIDREFYLREKLQKTHLFFPEDFFFKFFDSTLESCEKLVEPHLDLLDKEKR